MKNQNHQCRGCTIELTAQNAQPWIIDCGGFCDICSDYFAEYGGFCQTCSRYDDRYIRKLNERFLSSQPSDFSARLIPTTLPEETVVNRFIRELWKRVPPFLAPENKDR